MNPTNYVDAREVLASNGYAPAPIYRGHAKPPGPWAVMQPAWNTADNAEALAAVLTAARPAVSPASPIQNAAATRLTAVTVAVLPEHADTVDAFLVERGGRVVRVAQSGERTYIFGNDGEPFSALTSGNWHAGSLRVNSAAFFVALAEDENGNAFSWPRSSLIDVRRDELASLDAEGAQRLVDEFSTWADEREPAPPPRAPYVPKPLIEPGKRWTFDNGRARGMLEKAGFHLVPVEFRSTSPDIAGKNGVGFLLNPSGVANAGKLVLVEVWSRSREVADALAKLGHRVRTDEVLPKLIALIKNRTNAPSRRSSTGATAFLFRNGDAFTFPTIEHRAEVKLDGKEVIGTSVRVRFVTRDAMVTVSGDDLAGKPYEWDVDMLSIKYDELPALAEWQAKELCDEIDALMLSGKALDEAPAKGKGSRKSAA